MKEAMFYEQEGEGLRCRLCPHGCLITSEETGVCRVRHHRRGKLYTENYGFCTSAGLDPIEKKPLYHFHPGEYIFSVGTKGCNLKCQHCQNWSIAHGEPQKHELAPEDLVAMVKKKMQGIASLGIAYTYSEPSVWYEYVFDVARLARQDGLKNVLVTNAFLSEEALLHLVSYIDAMNIDIKGFSEEFYRKICGARLGPVLEATKRAAQHCHVEITTLVIPDLNDDPGEINSLCRWIAEELGPDTPLHLSRYFPNYKLDYPSTPVETLERSQDIARQHLNYVYLGNVGGTGSNTYCPQCAALVIERQYGTISLQGLTEDNNCQECGQPIALVR